MTCSPLEGASWKRLQPESNTKSAFQNQRRPLVAQAFRPANGRRAALKGCATRDSETHCRCEVSNPDGDRLYRDCRRKVFASLALGPYRSSACASLNSTAWMSA